MTVDYIGARLVRGELRCSQCNAYLADPGAVVFEGFHDRGCKYECSVCGQVIISINNNTARCSRRRKKRKVYVQA